MENDKSENGRKKPLILVGTMILVGGISIVLGLKYKPKSSQVLNVNQQEQGDQKDGENNYSKLQELFKKDETILTDLATRFDGVGFTNSEFDLRIYLDKKCTSGKFKKITPQDVDPKDMVGDDSVFDRIEEDKSFTSELIELEKSYNATMILYIAKAHELRFYISAEETPSIKDNNNMGTMFIYSKEKDLESKGYHKINDNWYMWVIPKTEVNSKKE